MLGIHPNTVRFYEEMKYLPPVNRKSNGYREFTDEHLDQMRLIKIAFRSEILQSNLRRKAIEIIKLCAKHHFDEALNKSEIYRSILINEKRKGEEAAQIVQDILSNQEVTFNSLNLKRAEAAKYIDVSIDVLRNWELNGLIEVPRKINGYRMYTEQEIRKLKIICVLRHANYSLVAILRMLTQLREGSSIDLKALLNTPSPNEDIVYVTDKLITSLSEAINDATEMIEHIKKKL